MLKIWARSAQPMTSSPQERSGTPRIGSAGVRRFLGLQGEVGMGFNRYAGALLASAAGLGMSLGVTASYAADMPLKAPPPVVEPLDMHAFFDLSFKNAYITPRGLLVTNTGLTTQVLTGLSADVYKDKCGFINLISVYGYTWNDIWSQQAGGTVGNWNEFDWAVGGTVKFAQDWKFGV